MQNRPIIELKDVDMVKDGREILRSVSFTVNDGDFIAITGPNGGGKTTLLRIILKLIRPTGGSVRYFDANGDETGCLSIGYLPQKNMIDSKFPITVRDVVGLGILGKKNLTKDERRAMVDEAIELVGLSYRSEASLGVLSGGQLQRALMARAVISKPSLLVLDEPLSYVDRQFEQRIYEIVKAMSEHTTILLVSHDMTTIASMANRHLLVNRTAEFCHCAKHFSHFTCCD